MVQREGKCHVILWNLQEVGTYLGKRCPFINRKREDVLKRVCSHGFENRIRKSWCDSSLRNESPCLVIVRQLIVGRDELLEG